MTNDDTALGFVILVIMVALSLALGFAGGRWSVECERCGTELG